MNKRLYIASGILLLALHLSAASHYAATLTVTNKNDSGAGSLRQAALDAGSGDTIKFAAVLRGSIQLTAEIVLDKNLTIQGPGANILGVDGRELPTSTRVFNVLSGNVRIFDLRISRGFSAGAGGGIAVDSANLTLNNCLISGNTAESAGGIFVSASAVVSVSNSTIAGNISFTEGGGIAVRGGSATVTNSLVIGNEAGDGAGVSVDNAGTITLLNTTITGNGSNGSSSGDIGGLRVSGATANLKNTIVAGNLALGTSIPDVGGAVTSQGTNLIGNTTGGSGFTASDLLNVNPMFGGFANNGGGTYTMSLLAASPAINAGNNVGAPPTDQRAVARPQGGTVDIGSYESGGSNPLFGRIVFSRNGANYDIFSINPTGTGELQLTNHPGRDDSPKWSPNGIKIVFTSDRDGGPDEIYTMFADGTLPTRLTNNAVPDANPVWSPDGTKIAFDRNGQIWVMNDNGTGETQMTGSSFAGIKSHPSWSPDGSQVVFHNNRGFGAYRLQIIDSGCSGCNGQNLVTNLPDNFDPIRSPDGNSIAYSNDQIDFTNHSQPLTFLLSPELRNLNFPIRPLPTTANMFSPAWSPDGTKLLYRSSSGGFSFIDADGGNAAPLSISGDNYRPHWNGFNTPNGANITVVSGTSSVNYTFVSAEGTTTVVPYDDPPIVPVGYACTAPPGQPCKFPSYEVGTTATYSGLITVCLHVPHVTDPIAFDRLRILHYVNGTPTDATILSPDTPAPNFATKTICARVNSLSPFVVAEQLAPTAAPVAVGGRIVTFDNRGISKAHVTLMDQSGNTRAALTNAFGYYRFDEVVAGQSYIVSVSSKRYQFEVPARVVHVLKELSDVTFVALPDPFNAVNWK